MVTNLSSTCNILIGELTMFDAELLNSVVVKESNVSVISSLVQVKMLAQELCFSDHQRCMALAWTSVQYAVKVKIRLNMQAQVTCYDSLAHPKTEVFHSASLQPPMSYL